nr:reverse transcriptase domain-containing protein [Tanacetum cinerariifolium]
MTATLKYRDVPNDAIKLMLFPYSLEDIARIYFFQNQPSTSRTLSSTTIPNPNGEMKAVTTRSGLAYEGPSIPTESPLDKVDEQNTKEILDKEHSNSSGSTAQVQPLVVFADALLLMPKFASKIKSLLANKDKLFELAKVPLNENCSAMLLEKLPEKLGDSGKFLISCDFPGMEVCHALSDLGASINLMPLSIWKKLSLPELTPTRMTLELADRSITRPKGVAEDVFVKVGNFHFPTDFVVVDFEADPRVPLILGRSFLRTSRALIDVYGEEITLRVNDESITFNLNQTMRYSSTYDDTLVNRVDVIDVACEDFMQDVPIVKSSLPTLTSFGESDFFLKEIEDFLNDDSIPTGIENSVYDPEEDILFLEKLLNEDPFQLPLMDLKLSEESKEKYSVEKPSELELKELPSHLEYAFLEDYNKLSVIIAKNLKGDEREALINILMEEDYKPAVQSQKRVNLKIHDVIKKEVIKLLDAGMIYPISDSPWRVCIDYRKLNDATRKDHFPLPLMDKMLERRKLLSHALMEPSRTDACPLACVMPQVFGDSFSSCLTNLDKMLNRCEETNLVLNWEKCHFMSKEGIFLGHKISKSGIEVDIAKVNVIAKLPHLTTVKGVKSFLGHTSFYRRFIQDFSKIARPMTHLFEKKTHFVFSKECIEAFNTLKKKLTEALILVVPDWNMPFELMKLLKFSKLAMKDLSEAIMVPISQRKSDRGTHFCNDQFTRVMIKYEDTHRLATAYHPQTSGQVEVSNRGLKRILERTVGENRTSWSDKLDDTLWAFCTAYKNPIRCTPYKLVYGKSCHLLIELEHRAYWALKHVNFNLKTVGDHRKLQLNELSELLDQAYENFVIYKERTKRLHDSKIKNRIFNVGDQVLLFNSRLKIFSGKLKTRWSGPFTITCVFPYGTIELSQPNGPNFKVNGHRIKHYFGGDIPSNVALDLHTFPMDN